MVGRVGFEPTTNGLTYHYSFRYQIILSELSVALDTITLNCVTPPIYLFVVWTMPLPY